MPFRDIVGHAVTTGLLRQAVARGRVPQSLLFAGPEGVGKRAVATALAQAVNCPIRRKSGGDDACGVCPTCTRIARGIHTDVVVIDKGEEASIKIKILRERLLDGHRLPAIRGRPPRVHHRSGGRDDRRGPGRAPQDARGAAARGHSRAGHGVRRHAPRRRFSRAAVASVSGRCRSRRSPASWSSG